MSELSVQETINKITMLLPIIYGIIFGIGLRWLARSKSWNDQSRKRLRSISTYMFIVTLVMIAATYIFPRFFWIIPILICIAVIFFIVLAIKITSRSQKIPAV